ncbi:MAG: hypothetical protein KGL48_14305 [Sphingomonadales bacterium]|nr:hypothetical protein [Sphingomonadales bacterium]MDE2569246.1 hypothetical protein [Sphingomonadales bacterium]
MTHHAPVPPQRARSASAPDPDNRRFDERLTVALLHSRTLGGVPTLGRRGPEAERHARAFDALAAKVEAGELESIRHAVSPAFSGAELVAALREFATDREG